MVDQPPKINKRSREWPFSHQIRASDCRVPDSELSCNQARRSSSLVLKNLSRDRLLIFSSSEVRLPLLTLRAWLYIYYKSCKNRKPRATKALCPSVSPFFLGLVAFPLLNIGIGGSTPKLVLGAKKTKMWYFRKIIIDNAFFAAKVRGVPGLSVVERLGRRGVRKRAKSGVERWSLGFGFRKS